MKIPADTTFIVDLTIEVEDEDSIEVMDFKIDTTSGIDPEQFEDMCEEADLGQIFGLDDDGILIAPDEGVYVYKCAVNASLEQFTVLSSRQLSDDEAAKLYSTPDFPDAF